MPQPPVAVPLRDAVDPSVVFERVSAQESAVFWLDAGPLAEVGWSWVGVGHPEPDPARVRAVDLTQPPVTDEFGPFSGGWVGWIGYETGAVAMGAPRASGSDDVPGEAWLRVDDFYAFEHATGRAWAVSRSGRARELAVLATGGAAGAATSMPAPTATARARHSPEEYAALIERCRSHIREGDAYQLCLTTRFEVDGVFDAAEVYRRLRATSPSHHGGLIRIGDAALASATPERFLEISGGVARTHPIKGTRPRGADAESDRRLAEELSSDPKERAENVMIVDLMRNDLSRVGIPGSVRVDRLLEVESYPSVHQLVSSVSATLRRGTTLGRLLDAAFPAGSMTGAPKLSAMTILHRLEQGRRGVFSGCFGWVGDDGAADLAMVIRSVVIGPHRAVVGAGGGITWRSRVGAEVAEVGLKARAPLAALGAEVPPGWES